MAGSSLFSNLARGAKLLALLLFLLPWVAVSCSPRGAVEVAGDQAKGLPPAIASARDCTMITASGLQLAMGSAQASRDCAEVISTAAGMAVPADEDSDNDNHPFKDPNIWVIAGAVLILLSLIASFLLKGAMAPMAAAGGSALALCAFAYAVFIQAPNLVRDSILSGRGGMGGQNMPGLGGSGGPTATQVDKMIHTSPGIGFWLVLVALLGAIALNVMASRKPAAEAPPPAI
jgi:hypothetical protein